LAGRRRRRYARRPAPELRAENGSARRDAQSCQASNDAEVKIAAEYFAKLKYKPRIKVVEVKMVPKTQIVTGMLVAIEGGGMEPIGERIVETAQSLEPTEARDDASPFVAYVPIGSVKKGEALVTTGGSEDRQAIRCASSTTSRTARGRVTGVR
jgi:hypothetical protein